MNIAVLSARDRKYRDVLKELPQYTPYYVNTAKENWMENIQDSGPIFIGDDDEGQVYPFIRSTYPTRQTYIYRPHVVLLHDGKISPNTYGKMEHFRYIYVSIDVTQVGWEKKLMLVHPATPLVREGKILPALSEERKKYLVRLPPRYAYVWLLMRGDAYLPGVLVSAYSVRLRSSYECVCMITKDVTAEARDKLKEIMHEVIDVEYLTFPHIGMKTAKQAEMYPWIGDSFTKWACLQLDIYDKVLFMDADTITLKSLDKIFELPAPAGTFSSPFSVPYTEKKGMNNPYYGLCEGQEVPRDAILSGFKDSFVVFGSGVLLEPNANDYARFLKELKAAGTFGFPGCTSGFDEQSITWLYTHKLRRKWTQIDQTANCVPWKVNWMEGASPRVFHYINKKPWDFKRGEYLDLEAWWELVESLCTTYPSLCATFPVSKAKEYGCGWCKLLHRNYKDHTVFTKTELTCPIIGRDIRIKCKKELPEEEEGEISL